MTLHKKVIPDLNIPGEEPSGLYLIDPLLLNSVPLNLHIFLFFVDFETLLIHKRR